MKFLPSLALMVAAFFAQPAQQAPPMEPVLWNTEDPYYRRTLNRLLQLTDYGLPIFVVVSGQNGIPVDFAVWGLCEAVDDDLDGTVDYFMIYIAASHPSAEWAADTLLHEFAHVASTMMGGSGHDAHWGYWMSVFYRQVHGTL